MNDVDELQERWDFDMGCFLSVELGKILDGHSALTRGTALAIVTAQWINSHGRPLTAEIEEERDQLIAVFVRSMRKWLDAMDADQLELAVEP